jgi:hypothetical protein
MPYITREDGQRFVIPSYRDVLTVQQKSQLKNEILQLSESYGSNITLQKKGTSQYEVAFSSDRGYLLGESIWNYYQKPTDLIYCETIPNTTEAILVIVKSGSVYLDGSFPLDTIPEELVIFLTQQNNFEIYVYGDVPISKEPEAGKFSFEASAVKSFNVLEQPIFPGLPLLKAYQLQPVDLVLREQGIISVLPLKQILIVLVVLVLGYLGYWYFTSAPPPPPPPPPPQVNPYQAYFDALTSPPPSEVISKIAKRITIFFQISGWTVKQIDYAGGALIVHPLSAGGSVEELRAWGEANKTGVVIQPTGMLLNTPLELSNRPMPMKIYRLQKVLTVIIDKLAKVLPGNSIGISAFNNKDVFTTVQMTINFNSISPAILELIGKQLEGLPLVLNNVSLTLTDENGLNGSIMFDVLGN